MDIRHVCFELHKVVMYTDSDLLVIVNSRIAAIAILRRAIREYSDHHSTDDVNTNTRSYTLAILTLLITILIYIYSRWIINGYFRVFIFYLLLRLLKPAILPVAFAWGRRNGG